MFKINKWSAIFSHNRIIIICVQDDLLFIYRALESHIGSQYSLNASSSSSCDLAGLSDPVISPNITVIPSSLTVIPSTLPSVISSTLPTSLSLQQPCDLIPTSMMAGSGCGSDLTPPQTPQQTQASIITAAAITASNCLASSPQSCGILSPTLHQQQHLQHLHMQQQMNICGGANSQPIVQPLSSPADHIVPLHHQHGGMELVTSPAGTLGRNRNNSNNTMVSINNQSSCVSPLANNGGVMSPINTICNPGITSLPPNGCPGNGYPGNNILVNNSNQCYTLSNMHGVDSLSGNTRVSPEGREDTPLTGDGILPLELAPLPPV